MSLGKTLKHILEGGELAVCTWGRHFPLLVADDVTRQNEAPGSPNFSPSPYQCRLSDHFYILYIVVPVRTLLCHDNTVIYRGGSRVCAKVA